MSVSVRQVFGIDTDLEVPAFSKPSAMQVDIDSDRPPAFRSLAHAPMTNASLTDMQITSLTPFALSLS